jgi:ferredoxin
MPQAANKHSLNIAGPWYCTNPEDASGEGCIACSVCYTGAPDFFASDENGHAYVAKQPTTDDEIALCQEQLEACPVTSIGADSAD